VTFTLPSLSIDREAIDLFVDRAARARPGFVVTDQNAAAIGEICQRLDGMPLALELAAARIRSLSPEQICDGLSDRFRLLSTGARTLMPRQQTLRGSVDWSYDLLAEDERAALRRLSIFSGGFDLEAAQTVVAHAEISHFDVTDLIGSLVDKSLVIVDDRGRLIRYRMLETLREYGAERLDEAGERHDVARRHRAHYRMLLQRAAAEEEGPNQADWRARVMGEMDNVRAALQSALAEDDGAALIELTCGAGNTWTLMGRSTEHHRWLVEALAHAPDDSPFRASAVYQLGITDQFVGDLESSHRHLGESVPLYRASGDEVGALWALAEYAFTVAFKDGLDAAAPVYEEGIAAARAIGADGARFSMEYGVGQYMALAGRPAEARDQFEAALAGPSPVEHFRRWAILGLGLCHTVLGDLDLADGPVEESIGYARAAGDRMTLGMGLWVRTLLRVAQGRIEEARATAAELEVVVLDLGPLNWAWVMHGIAAFAIAEGDARSAIDVSDEALSHLAQAHPELKALHHATKAEAFTALGDLVHAREEIAAVLHATAEGGAPSDRVRALITLAGVDRRERHGEDAEAHAHEALRLSRAMSHKRGVVDALEVLGGCAADRESYAEAARLFGAAAALREAAGYAYRSPIAEQEVTQAGSAVESALGADESERARAEGAALSLEDACDYAARGRGERKRPATGWAALTATEARVAALAAHGLTNAQVGEQLFISRHTVDSHLRHIYAKLGVSSRAELATRVAREDGAGA
jgi:DNA-binding CsgD family transcriptional regulator